MARRQTRRTISINRQVHEQFMAWAHQQGQSASHALEVIICEKMGVPMPDTAVFDASGVMVARGSHPLQVPLVAQRRTMTRPSIDEGPKIPWQVHVQRVLEGAADTLTIEDVSAILDVGYCQASRLAKHHGVKLKRKQQRPRQHGKGWKAANYAREHPELTLRQVARKFRISHQAVAAACDRFGVARLDHRPGRMPVADPVAAPEDQSGSCAQTPSPPTL